jgi:hypothetical protein
MKKNKVIELEKKLELQANQISGLHDLLHTMQRSVMELRWLEDGMKENNEKIRLLLDHLNLQYQPSEPLPPRLVAKAACGGIGEAAGYMTAKDKEKT